MIQRHDELWIGLEHRITEYAEAMIADSWKGGGDPADVEVIEAQLTLARLLLLSHIEKMKREFE